jgi:hypothetical protein
MGWTYTDLARNRLTLEQAKQNHVRDATNYGDRAVARIIMHEWHDKTWYAIIGLYTPTEDQQRQKPETIFLRTDIIDTAGGQFGYKDMTESVGPRLNNRPSRALAKAVFKYIPIAPGYAKEFRDWAGIPYLQPARHDSANDGVAT